MYNFFNIFIPGQLQDKHMSLRTRYVLLVFTAILGFTIKTWSVFELALIYKLQSLSYVGILSALITLISYLFFRFNEKFFLPAAWIIIINSTLYLIFIVWAEGGFHTPAIFWLTVPPLFAATVIGPGAGFLFSFFGLGFFIYLFDHTPESLGSPLVFDAELLKTNKLIVLVEYVIFITSYYLIYGYSIKKSDEELLQRKETIETLLRVILHDLSTPLAIVEGSVKIIKPDDPKLTEVLKDKAIRASGHIKEIIAQVRSYQAVEDGKYTQNKKYYNLKEILFEQKYLYDKRLEEKNVELEFVGADNLECLVDKNVITYQIFNNILTNAIKFSTKGSKIKVELSEDHSYSYFAVIDEGIGIPSHIMENLYSMFDKTSRKGTGGESGTGYGMPIVKKFVEIINGTIEVTSKNIDQYPDEHGTTVKIGIPKENVKPDLN
jgi:signal transduction histidine kinase